MALQERISVRVFQYSRTRSKMPSGCPVKTVDCWNRKMCLQTQESRFNAGGGLTATTERKLNSRGSYLGRHFRKLSYYLPIYIRTLHYLTMLSSRTGLKVTFSAYTTIRHSVLKSTTVVHLQRTLLLATNIYKLLTNHQQESKSVLQFPQSLFPPSFTEWMPKNMSHRSLL